jgi:hypothetical protein
MTILCSLLFLRLAANDRAGVAEDPSDKALGRWNLQVTSLSTCNFCAVGQFHRALVGANLWNLRFVFRTELGTDSSNFWMRNFSVESVPFHVWNAKTFFLPLPPLSLVQCSCNKETNSTNFVATILFYAFRSHLWQERLLKKFSFVQKKIIFVQKKFTGDKFRKLSLKGLFTQSNILCCRTQFSRIGSIVFFVVGHFQMLYFTIFHEYWYFKY